MHYTWSIYGGNWHASKNISGYDTELDNIENKITDNRAENASD
jgi:hypothetical protein